MAKQHALHHQHGREPNRLVLHKKHANNTADIGLEDGTVLVHGCPIGPVKDQPHRSYCIIVDDKTAQAAKPSKAELKKLATELRQTANAAKEAFDKAAEAAELAGPDAENAEALALAALEAEEAYKAADKAADEAEAALK